VGSLTDPCFARATLPSSQYAEITNGWARLVLGGRFVFNYSAYICLYVFVHTLNLLCNHTAAVTYPTLSCVPASRSRRICMPFDNMRAAIDR
jgi:hypothetical protein